MDIRLEGDSGSQYPLSIGKHLVLAVELIAYGDESGVHDSPLYCVVAGYIGSPREWEKFHAQWKATLDEFGVDSFHAKDFFQQQSHRFERSPYFGWPHAKKAEFLARLLVAINNRRLFPLVSAVDVQAFNLHTHGVRRYLTGAEMSLDGKFLSSGAPTRPYQMALAGLFMFACEKARDDSKIHFILDRNDNEAPLAVQRFNVLRDEYSAVEYRWERLGRLTFTGSRDEPGLQVADLHAYAIHRFLHHRAIGKDLDIPTSGAVAALAKKKMYPGVTGFTQEAMEYLMAHTMTIPMAYTAFSE